MSHEIARERARENLQHNELRLGEQGTGTGTAMDGRITTPFGRVDRR